MKRFFVAAICVSLVLVGAAYAAPGKPDFSPRIYADGEAWGTKVTGPIPGIRGNNQKSYDKLFVITNSNNPDPQLPVGEAAPGNPMYNGGRWWTHTVMWTEEGFEYHGTVPILMSYDDIMLHADMGHLMITEGPPEGPGAPPPFFSCPLLPVEY